MGHTAITFAVCPAPQPDDFRRGPCTRGAPLDFETAHVDVDVDETSDGNGLIAPIRLFETGRSEASAGSRLRLKNQIERRLGCTPEAREAAGGHHFSEPCFARLCAERSSAFL